MIHLGFATLSDSGLQREHNEDRVWGQVYLPSEGGVVGLFVVCDGMGGHLGGECASHWAVETIKRELSSAILPNPMATIRLSAAEINTVSPNSSPTQKTASTEIQMRVQAAIERANGVVFEYARNKPREAGDAGTTLTMAFVQGSHAIIANVGDSRTYLLRAGALRQITTDHSLVANLASAGQIRPEEIFTHPQRNVIYRTLGQKSSVQVDIFNQALEPDDHLLLCSDGLWEMLREPKEIIRIIQKEHDLQKTCQRLVDAANKAGGEDNISVILVKVEK